MEPSAIENPGEFSREAEERIGNALDLRKKAVNTASSARSQLAGQVPSASEDMLLWMRGLAGPRKRKRDLEERLRKAELVRARVEREVDETVEDFSSGLVAVGRSTSDSLNARVEEAEFHYAEASDRKARFAEFSESFGAMKRSIDEIREELFASGVCGIPGDDAEPDADGKLGMTLKRRDRARASDAALRLSQAVDGFARACGQSAEAWVEGRPESMSWFDPGNVDMTVAAIARTETDEICAAVDEIAAGVQQSADWVSEVRQSLEGEEAKAGRDLAEARREAMDAAVEAEPELQGALEAIDRADVELGQTYDPSVDNTASQGLGG